MLKIILMLFVIVYIIPITSNIGKILRMNECLDILVAFLNSGKSHSYGIITKNDNFDECLQKLLQHYPAICEFRNFNDPSLSYGETSWETYSSAAELYRSFLMKQNFLINSLCHSFNPINAVKKMLSLPCTILNFFGITLNVHSSRIFNLIGWIITYILGMYQDEVKILFTAFLKHL